jgi:4-hydroxy-tetrahydrodipicolinate synthase
MAKKQKLTGTGVALITPFLESGEVDYPALEKLTDSVIRGGVDFLVALGTTAETPALSGAEKQDVLSAVIRYAKGNLPVVCGIGGNNTEEVVQQLKTMDLRGVDAILSVAPYYNKPSQEGMYQHFKKVAAATNKNVILYNVPGRTGSNLLPATVVRLANDCRNITGIKEASGNMAQCLELLRTKPENFLVLSGDDNLVLAQMAIGMDGMISVAANCFTTEMIELMNLSIVGKYEKARQVMYKILPGIDLLFAEGNPSGVKSALYQQGICENVLRLPLVPVSEGLALQIGEFLKSL